MSCSLAYFSVITDINMVEQDGFKEVLKTPIERWTNWGFWKSTKNVPNIVPMKSFIVSDEQKVLICHPSMKDALEEHIEELI